MYLGNFLEAQYKKYWFAMLLCNIKIRYFNYWKISEIDTSIEIKSQMLWLCYSKLYCSFLEQKECYYQKINRSRLLLPKLVSQAGYVNVSNWQSTIGGELVLYNSLIPVRCFDFVILNFTTPF